LHVSFIIGYVPQNEDWQTKKLTNEHAGWRVEEAVIIDRRGKPRPEARASCEHH
jgi:hypothetical protein